MFITMKKLSEAIFLLVFISAFSYCKLESVEAQEANNDAVDHTSQAPFDSLSAAQKRVLAPMREKWAELPAAQQQRLIKGSRRWAGMSKEQKAKARDKMKRWLSLAPEKRQRLLQRLERYQAMSPRQRQRLRRTFRKFRQLPKEQRQALRQRWQGASAAERRQLRQKLMNQNDSQQNAE